MGYEQLAQGCKYEPSLLYLILYTKYDRVTNFNIFFTLISNWQNAISYKQARINSSNNSINDKEKERKKEINLKIAV